MRIRAVVSFGGADFFVPHKKTTAPEAREKRVAKGWPFKGEGEGW